MGKINYKKLIFIFLLYLAIAVIFTWPLSSQLSTHGFGFDEDSPYHIWHNWWLKFSLFNLHQNPLTTNYIFFPQRIPLIYDANSFVFAVLTLPLQTVFSVLTASNLIFLLSFVLSSFSMFLLANSIVKNNLIAFLAGLIFAFSPYTMAQATDGHTNLTTTWIIPLFTLALLNTLNYIQKNGFNRVTCYLCVGLGTIASLQFYSDFTYTTFMAIETGIIVLYKLLQNLRDRHSLIRVIKNLFVIGILAGSIAVVLTSPILLEIHKISKTGFRPGSPLWVQNEWSADLAAFFRPPDRTIFFKPISYTPPRGSVEGTVFFGYSVMLLYLVALVKTLFAKNRPKENSSSKIGLWIFTSLAIFLLSLGPSLHINGKIQFDVFNFKNVVFPLPWALIHAIPFIGETQEPARLNPFLLTAVAMVIAIFLRDLINLSISGRKIVVNISVVILIFLVLIEYLQVPFPTTDLKPSNIYNQIAEDKTNFSVLVLPLGFNSGNIALGKSPIGSLQYYQVIHEHPSFRGTVARLPSWAFEYYQKLPLIKVLIDPSKPADSDDLNSQKAYKTIKSELQIKYIVVHKDKYESETYKKTEDLLERVLGINKVFESQTVDAYKLE